MKINITGKNFTTYKRLEDTIDKKFEKLGKYFSDDITINVVLSQERGKDKIEVTINAKGTVFRAEEVAVDVYEGIDKAVDKLSRQMAKYKGKLQKRYNDNKSLRFENIPEVEEDEEIEEVKIVKTKKFELQPMEVEEAIIRMEMLGHDFFIFKDCSTSKVSILYKRKDNNYGIIETN